MSTLLRSKGLKSFGRYSAVGLELLLSIAVGYYGGRWLDGKFGTKWIAFVGFIIGCYAGFRGLFRTAKAMQKDIEREERLERGEDIWAEREDESGPRVTEESATRPTSESDSHSDSEEDELEKKDEARRAKEKASYL